MRGPYMKQATLCPVYCTRHLMHLVACAAATSRLALVVTICVGSNNLRW
eukprot:jgi/Mesvir1/26802/Mv25910-RA.1